jgi:hypothetical protein
MVHNTNWLARAFLAALSVCALFLSPLLLSFELSAQKENWQKQAPDKCVVFRFDEQQQEETTRNNLHFYSWPFLSSRAPGEDNKNKAYFITLVLQD